MIQTRFNAKWWQRKAVKLLLLLVLLLLPPVKATVRARQHYGKEVVRNEEETIWFHPSFALLCIIHCAQTKVFLSTWFYIYLLFYCWRKDLFLFRAFFFFRDVVYGEGWIKASPVHRSLVKLKNLNEMPQIQLLHHLLWTACNSLLSHMHTNKCIHHTTKNIHRTAIFFSLLLS